MRQNLNRVTISQGKRGSHCYHLLVWLKVAWHATELSLFCNTQTQSHTYKEETRQKKDKCKRICASFVLPVMGAHLSLFSLSVSFLTPELFCNFFVPPVFLSTNALPSAVFYGAHDFLFGFFVFDLFSCIFHSEHILTSVELQHVSNHIFQQRTWKTALKNKEVSHLLLRKGWTGSWCSNLLDWSSMFASERSYCNHPTLPCLLVDWGPCAPIN